MGRVYTIYPKKRKRFGFGFTLTTKLIIINIIAYFVGFILLSVYGEEFVLRNLALTPSIVLSGGAVWTLITSMFMHGGFFHIFANMFSLFFIGTFLERIIGKKRFFWVYMISGIIGGVFFILASLIFGGLDVPAVGASGAIFGLLGVLAVLVPWSKVYLIAGPLILLIIDFIFRSLLPTSVSSMLSTLITILIFFQIFAMLSFNPRIRKFAIPLQLPMWLLPIIAIVPLIIIGYFVPLPIGNSAHLGGLIVGLIYGLYLRRKFPRKTKKISNLFR
jgi:membrane associated rhomboid family serine protease